MREEMRTFGYLCPKCGKPVFAARSVFALEASNAEVACECGGSALSVRFDGERYHLTVPCGLCGETHTAVCTPSQVLEGASALACGHSGQFSCFMGPEGVVERNLKDLEQLAQRERGREEGEPPAAFANEVIMYEVLSELKNIAGRPGGITCGCGTKEYAMEVRRSAVDLICRRCGTKLRIPAATDRDLDDLCCHMKLVIPGRPEM